MSAAGNSLEAERQAILDRMQMRREHYRRMLTGGDYEQIADAHPTDEGHALAHMAHNPGPGYHTVPTQFPRSTIMRTVTEHPYLVALGVAAVVLIGPKRLMRTALGATSTVSALAASNQSHVDLLGKALAMAGAYVQGRSNDSSP